MRAPKDGARASWVATKTASVVKRYRLLLSPELYEHLNPMLFEAAAQMEKDLAGICAGTGANGKPILASQFTLLPPWQWH
jgi:hypothetical protein